MKAFAQTFRRSLLDEVKLPDYTGRHLFTTKLRLIIFLACWALVLIFFSFVFEVAPYVPLIFNVAFLVTAICYNNVLNGRALFASLILESMADLISQTTIIYLLGGKVNPFFFFYVLYCITVGMFYGPKLALIASFLAISSYSILLFLLHFGIVPPIYYYENANFFSNSSLVPFIYVILTALFLAIALYGIKIGNYFSQIKENALAERNKQLLALHKISSTIHTVSALDLVIQQVLQGVIQGLGYDTCFLALFTGSEDRLKFYVPAMANLGASIDQWALPLDVEVSQSNAIYQAIVERDVVFRNDFSELTHGIVPPVSRELATSLQEEMGWKKFIVIPLISDVKVIGVLIGISRVSYVESGSVGILGYFATQVAVALESTYLFDELRGKNRELEEANRVKSEFLSLMSHELRTPLHAILGFSELIADGSMGAITAEQGHTLKEIRNNAKNLSELIDNILELAKAEAGKLKPIYSDFDFAETARQVAYTLSPLVREKGHTLTLNFPEKENFLLSADEGKMRQILTNLLSNAIKFTGEGGAISLSARRLPKEEVQGVFEGMTMDRGENFLYVEISDTGIGISPEHQEELFQPFKQVEHAFTRRYQGTGLGLALCKELVELHAGRIGMKSPISEEGKGSQFFFAIPCGVPTNS